MSEKRQLSCLQDRVICGIVTPLTEASGQFFGCGTGVDSHLHLDVHIPPTTSACIKPQAPATVEMVTWQDSEDQP